MKITIWDHRDPKIDENAQHLTNACPQILRRTFWQKSPCGSCDRPLKACKIHQDMYDVHKSWDALFGGKKKHAGAARGH